MYKVLLIKTSSMGDIIHTLPALSDAQANIPDIKFDWLVEPDFAEIPSWHPAVDNIIEFPLREFKESPLSSIFNSKLIKFLNNLRQQSYDLIIDAQGLLKSSITAKLANSKTIAGYCKNSAREKFSSLLYTKPITVPTEMHAIARSRQLFAQALGYNYHEQNLNYGIKIDTYPENTSTQPYIIFFHGTTWNTKLWPTVYWQQLGQIVNQNGYQIQLTHATPEQQENALLISENLNCKLNDKFNLNTAAQWINQSAAIIAVDTGFAHLATALNKPVVSIFGATSPLHTGTIGKKQITISSKLECAPCLKKTCKFSKQSPVYPVCYQEITPEIVWDKLKDLK